MGSAIFPCTLCIDILQSINQETPMQKERTKACIAEQAQCLLMECTVELGLPNDKLEPVSG